MGFCSRVKASTVLLPLLVVFLITVLLVARPQNAQAAINSQINFQGKLTNPDGTNVTNGSYSIIFSIYTTASGGTAVWTETQSSVTVADGVFRVALGSVTSLPGSVDFNTSSLYLGIKVGADPEMTPRVQFTAAPYAFNSDTLDGRDSAGFVQLGVAAAQADASTNSSIFINKTASGNLLQLQASASNVLTLSNTGVFTLVGSLNSSGGAISLSGNAGSSLTTSTGALTLTGAAASTWSTTAGNLTIQAGSGTVSLGSSTSLTANAVLNITSATTNAITLDSGTTGDVNIGTGANAKTITIGNTTGATDIANLVGGSTNAFSIQGASAVVYMQLDTTNSRLYVGNPSGDTTGVLLVLDNKTNAGDPTGVNGALYYNANGNKFRCYQNGVWQNCLTTNAVSLMSVLTTNSTGITNTETAVLSYTIPANTSTAGDTYRIRAYATRTGTNTATPTIRVRIGAAVLGGNIAATLTGLGNATAAARVYEALVTIRTVGATGTVGGGLTEYANAAGNLTSSTATVAVDTTLDRLIGLTFQSGNNANTYTFTYATIEKMSNLQ